MKWVIGFLSVLSLVLAGIYLWAPPEISSDKTCGVQNPLFPQQASYSSLPKPRSARSTQSIDPNPQAVLSPSEIAQRYIESRKDEWQLQPYHQLKPLEVQTPLGRDFVYSFYQGKLPILGMRIRLRVGPNNEVTEIENSYKPIPKVSTDPDSHLPVEQAIQVQVPRYQPQGYDPNHVALIFVRSSMEEGELAYSIPVKDSLFQSRKAQLVIRALDGQILNRSYAPPDFVPQGHH